MFSINLRSFFSTSSCFYRLHTVSCKLLFYFYKWLILSKSGPYYPSCSSFLVSSCSLFKPGLSDISPLASFLVSPLNLLISRDIAFATVFEAASSVRKELMLMISDSVRESIFFSCYFINKYVLTYWLGTASIYRILLRLM